MGEGVESYDVLLFPCKLNRNGCRKMPFWSHREAYHGGNGYSINKTDLYHSFCLGILMHLFRHLVISSYPLDFCHHNSVEKAAELASRFSSLLERGQARQGIVQSRDSFEPSTCWLSLG
jgi:hypothetical protein